jgi:hypothetical protein
VDPEIDIKIPWIGRLEAAFLTAMKKLWDITPGPLSTFLQLNIQYNNQLKYKKRSIRRRRIAPTIRKRRDKKRR